MRIVASCWSPRMMVLPVASGQLLARSFRGTLRWSVAVGVPSVIVGLGRVEDLGILAPGGSIVLVAAAVFAVVAVARSGAWLACPATEEAA